MARTFAISLLAAIAVAASYIAWREHGELDAQGLIVRKAAILASENAGLRQDLDAAERKAANAQSVVRRSQIERDVEAIRELKFTEPVVYETLDRAGIRQVVAGKLSAQFTDQEIADMSTGYSALGLLPPDFPLKQTYIDLLGEQIAAFYDQHQHKLFMFQDASLESGQNRVILAHELTHALQDQNFGLLKLALELKNNDDRAAAASALIEGDATLVMSQYMVKDMTWKTLTDTVGFSMTQSMVEMRKAPHYLREMLVFPYIEGQKFCGAIYERGGYPALSAVYANPPTSTAQILHPEKYFAEPREEPIAVQFADTTFQGKKPVADNVLGEMGCRILFGQQYPGSKKVDDAAEGWRGDRYLVFDGGKELVWKTVWASPEAAGAAAGEFEDAMVYRFVGPALDLAMPNLWAEASGKGPEPATPRWEVSPGHFLSMARDGPNGVIFILSTTKESAGLLENQFAGAPRR